MVLPRSDNGHRCDPELAQSLPYSLSVFLPPPPIVPLTAAFFRLPETELALAVSETVPLAGAPSGRRG